MSANKHRLYFLIEAVARRLKTTADEALLRRAGLTTSQVTALRIIVSEGAVSPKQISDRLGQRKSAMTTMVRRLEKAGFITKTPSDVDRRGYILRSTEAGREAIDHLVDAFAEIDMLIGEQLSSDQIESLCEDLQSMLSVLVAIRLRKTLNPVAAK